MNFQEFESRDFSLNLLQEMYNVPSKELSTNRITEILSVVTGQKLDNVMTSTIFNNAGLPLRNRAKTWPKEQVEKPARVTKAQTLNNLLGQLGLNVTTQETGPDEEEFDGTEQEQQYVDEVVENHQFMNAYSEPSVNGVA